MGGGQLGRRGDFYMAYISEAEWQRRVERGRREERILNWGGAIIAAVCFALVVAL